MSAKALDPHPVPALALDPPRADAWPHQPRRAPRLHGGNEYPRAAMARGNILRNRMDRRCAAKPGSESEVSPRFHAGTPS